MEAPSEPMYISLPLEELGGLIEDCDPVCEVEVEPLEECEEEALLGVAARRPRPLRVAQVHRERRRPHRHLAREGLPRDAVPVGVMSGLVPRDKC